MTSLIEHLRRVALRDGAAVGDGELLGSFIEHHDEAALAALVRRHGPMVWGVCRRLLAHHDAEDAFQATFLVLVRKAASVVPRAMVANWLYGVAHQTALQARRTVARRRTREVQVTQMPDAGTVRQDQWPDLQPVLDEELSRLPGIYRAVVVLCDLEGRTRKEVARQLGVPEGTVGGRLARARVLLAKRLTQRGVVLSGGALAAVLSRGAASASASPSLVAATIKTASLLAAGRAAGVVSVKVAALTEGVVRAMFVTKIKGVMAAVLVIVSLCGATGLICCKEACEPPNRVRPSKEGQVQNHGLREYGQQIANQQKTDEEKLQGKWRIVSETHDGVEEKQVRQVTIKKSFGLWSRFHGGRDDLLWFRLDGTANPKTIALIEVTHTDIFNLTDLNELTKRLERKLDDDEELIPGIYQIDGDTLKICVGSMGERPGNFESKKGSNNTLYIFKRAK